MGERKAIEVEVKCHDQGSQTVKPAEIYIWVVLCSGPIQNLSLNIPRGGVSWIPGG